MKTKREYNVGSSLDFVSEKKKVDSHCRVQFGCAKYFLFVLNCAMCIDQVVFKS